MSSERHRHTYSRRPGPPMPLREDLRPRATRRKLEHLGYLAVGLFVAILILSLLIPH